MTRTRRFTPTASASSWGDGDTETPIVRIYGGVGKRGLPVTYDEIPALIARLEQLHQEHQDIENLVDQLVIE